MQKMHLIKSNTFQHKNAHHLSEKKKKERKMLIKLGIEENFLYMRKQAYGKLTATILNSEKLKIIPLQTSGIK